MNGNVFLNNSFIQTIAENRRWTVSTLKKMPIDMNVLRNEGRIAGAKFSNGNSPLVSLYEVFNIVPGLNNATYNLNQNLDNFIVLDIEPKCPDDIKVQLLRLPYKYAELSMSGKGFHLVFDTPPTEYKEILMSKPAIQEEHGYYEFLLSHYVTFTGNMIYPKPNIKRKNISELYRLFDEIASKKKLAMNKEMDTSNIPSLEAIDFGKTIVDVLTRVKFDKRFEDYGNHSVYEFAVIGFYLHNMEIMISTTKYCGHKYNDQEKLRILYEVVKKMLPHRAKHEELRVGMPMLMYSCMRAITRVEMVDK